MFIKFSGCNISIPIFYSCFIAHFAYFTFVDAFGMMYAWIKKRTYCHISSMHLANEEMKRKSTTAINKITLSQLCWPVARVLCRGSTEFGEFILRTSSQHTSQSHRLCNHERVRWLSRSTPQISCVCVCMHRYISMRMISHRLQTTTTTKKHHQQ